MAEEPAGLYQRVAISPVMAASEGGSWFRGSPPQRSEGVRARREQLTDLINMLEQLSDDDLARVRDLVARLARR